MKAKKQRSHRILCADDHEPTCRSLAKLLEEALNVRVDTAFDGNSVIEELLTAAETADPFDLLVLDMQMPKRKPGPLEDELGLKLLNVLVQAQRHYPLLPAGTPVIMYVMNPKFEHAVLCLRAGAFDYIPKSDSNFQDNAGLLITRCKEILMPTSPAPDPVAQWLQVNIECLSREHGGKFAAIIDKEVAKEAGVQETAMGAFMLLADNSYRKVHRQILNNNVLRWNQPRVINIPTFEDLQNA